jgi:lipopolysaccharide export system protein LptA
MNKINFSVLLAVFTSFATLLSAGENLLYLVHADNSQGRVVEGERVRILTGNIEVYQDTLRMYCDEATFYENRSQAIFVGNVLIDDGHHKLRANRIVYSTDSRMAECTGQVRIGGINDSLYAEKFIYTFKERNAEGEKNLFIHDKQNQVKIWGDAGKYISADRYSKVTGHARFEQVNPDHPDTLLITANILEYFGEEPRRAYAVNEVTIYKDQVKATCDSATYRISEELVQLRINPLAWQGQNEMKGRTIDMLLDSLKVKAIHIEDNAHVKSLADSTQNKYNHLKGKSIQITLENGQPQQIIARKNAISVYVAIEDSLNQGTNSSSSDSILVFFNGGKIDSIAIIGGTEGIFYPPDFKGEIKGEKCKSNRESDSVSLQFAETVR